MSTRGKSQERMQRSEMENKVEIKERPEPHLQRIGQYLLWLSTLLLVTLEQDGDSLHVHVQLIMRFTC